MLFERWQYIRWLQAPKHTWRNCPRNARRSLGQRGLRNGRDWPESSEPTLFSDCSAWWVYLGTDSAWLALWGQGQSWSDMGEEALKVFLLSDKIFHNNIRLLFHKSPVTYHKAFLFCTTFLLFNQKMMNSWMTKEVRSLWDSEQQNLDFKRILSSLEKNILFFQGPIWTLICKCSWFGIFINNWLQTQNESAVRKGF